jgi:hypothetical protein
MFIPVVRIKQILDTLLVAIRVDHRTCNIEGREEESFLYRVLYGNALGTYDFYTQAINIFSQQDNSPRKIQTKIGFDLGHSSLPTIYVHQPSEPLKGVNTISWGLDQDSYKNMDGSETDKMFRGFGSVFEWVITAPSVMEVLLIYEVLHAALIASIDSFTPEFNSINFTGKEYVMKSDLVPETLYVKSIFLEVDYIKEVPRLIYRDIVNDINFELNGIYTEVPIDKI